MKKIALWISVGADDWTAEFAIIASNAQEVPESQGPRFNLH